MPNGPMFNISAFWGPRSEGAGRLAERWRSVVIRLRALDPAFAEWFTWEGENGIRVSLTDVEQHILDHKLDHDLLGFQFWVRTAAGPPPGPRNFSFWMNAGSAADNFSLLMTDFDVVPDPSLVTFRTFKAAILAIAESFTAERAYAYPAALTEHWKPQLDPHPAFPIAWISYVARRATHLVTPPPTAIVEHRPDGGLLMAATEETFDVGNPAHMAVARDIEAAVAPLNGHPWLPEDETA